jgi:hypothetical protein
MPSLPKCPSINFNNEVANARSISSDSHNTGIRVSRLFSNEALVFSKTARSANCVLV